MATLYTLTNKFGSARCEGKNAKGEKIIAAKRVCEFTGESFGLYVLCTNYSAGKMIKTWRVMEKYQKITREQAIDAFEKLNRA
jgi:hypothetical protein